MGVDSLMKNKPIDYGKYPVRTCRSLHHCEICGRDITHGNSYHDGGPGKRVHVLCEKERRLAEYRCFGKFSFSIGMKVAHGADAVRGILLIFECLYFSFRPL